MNENTKKIQATITYEAIYNTLKNCGMVLSYNMKNQSKKILEAIFETYMTPSANDIELLWPRRATAVLKSKQQKRR